MNESVVNQIKTNTYHRRHDVTGPRRHIAAESVPWGALAPRVWFSAPPRKTFPPSALRLPPSLPGRSFRAKTGAFCRLDSGLWTLWSPRPQTRNPKCQPMSPHAQHCTALHTHAHLMPAVHTPSKLTPISSSASTSCLPSEQKPACPGRLAAPSCRAVALGRRREPLGEVRSIRGFNRFSSLLCFLVVQSLFRLRLRRAASQRLCGEILTFCQSCLVPVLVFQPQLFSL